MTKFLTEENVNNLLNMDDALDSLEEIFAASSEGKIINLPRKRIDIEGSNFNFMAASWEEKGIIGYKSYVAGSKGLSFHVLIYSLEDNQLLTMIEANRLGQLRTGAASGVATKYLSGKDSIDLGVYGSGFQAETQIEAISRVKNIKSCVVYSRSSEKREKFCEKMTDKLGFSLQPTDDPQECAVDKDVIVTVTTSAEPVLMGDWVSSGTHINAAGSNHALKKEIDLKVVEKSDLIVVDDLNQAKTECGDLIQSGDDFDWSNVLLLEDIVSGKKKGSNEGISLFESQGVALEDIAIGFRLFQKSNKENVGTELN